MEKGDRAAIYTQNNPQFLKVQYGAWKHGAIVVPLNPMLKKKELDYHLNDSGAKVLVCLEGVYQSVAREVVPDTSVEHVLTTSELDFLPEEAADGTTVLEDNQKQRFENTDDLLPYYSMRDQDGPRSAYPGFNRGHGLPRLHLRDHGPA